MGNEGGSLETGEMIMKDTATDEDWEGTTLEEDLESGDLDEETYAKVKTFQDQQGVMKVTPVMKKQGFHSELSGVEYIAEGVEDPQIQIFPISDVNVTPHQISFDFFDTTEGKIGISNATEKHMIVECDVFVTELIYFYWNHGEETSSFDAINTRDDQYEAVANMIDSSRDEGNDSDEDLDELLTNFEDTQEFIEFRQNFLVQHSGWVCTFTSNVFGTFDGVFTEVTYEVPSGETGAKFHLKIEEAIFTADYSEDGKKNDGTSNGSQENSGTV